MWSVCGKIYPYPDFMSMAIHKFVCEHRRTCNRDGDLNRFSSIKFSIPGNYKLQYISRILSTENDMTL